MAVCDSLMPWRWKKVRRVGDRGWMGWNDKRGGTQLFWGDEKEWVPQGRAARRWPRCCSVEEVATTTPTADPTPGGMNGLAAGCVPDPRI